MPTTSTKVTTAIAPWTSRRAAAASPYELVLVLFDGLLDELARARGHIEAKRYQQKGQSLEKCLNILGGLNGALDYENGGNWCRVWRGSTTTASIASPMSA